MQPLNLTGYKKFPFVLSWKEHQPRLMELPFLFLNHSSLGENFSITSDDWLLIYNLCLYSSEICIGQRIYERKRGKK